jgi:hypothetical protein
MKTILLLPCLIAIIIGCRSGSIDPIHLNGTQPIEIELKVGEEKTVILSDSLNNRTFIAIKFVEINDGRCSADKCRVCYGGYANAKFQVSSSSQTDSINLSRISCIDYDMPTDSPMFARQKVQGVGLGLVNLNDPNKRSLSKYVAKLRISRW